MLIHDIKPNVRKISAAKIAIDSVRRVHTDTNLLTISKRRPQLRQYKSTDMLRLRPSSKLNKSLKKNVDPELKLKSPADERRLKKPQQIKIHRPTPATTGQRPHKLLSFVQYPAFIIVLILMAFSYPAGQIIIASYALFVIFVHISSKYTFITIGILITAIVTTNLLGYITITERLIIYAYELLVIGILQTIISTWLENKTVKNPRIRV